jgi:uncharacterized protein YjaZ
LLLEEEQRSKIMKFRILDTQATYQRLFDAPDDVTRETIFRAEIAEPFDRVVRVVSGGSDVLAAFNMWGMSPTQFAEPEREKTQQVFDILRQHKAWNAAAQSLDDARHAFSSYADRIPLDEIVFALTIMRPTSWGGDDQGYTGFGGVPGYILTCYSMPNAYNLPRIGGTTVHELHHNIRFTLFPFIPGRVTLGDYIVAEGLAEAFAGEIYGDDIVGYYVTDFDDSRLEETKRLIGGEFDLTDFNRMRAYVFGDTIADMSGMGMEKVGVPDYAGYALGYRAVKAYQARTGKSIVEMTFRPAEEILCESGFFA